QNAVAGVLRLASHIALRRPLLASFGVNGEMNVPRTARIGHRLDSPEKGFAVCAGQEYAQTPENFFADCWLFCCSLGTGALMIHLPDLNQGISNRASLGAKNAPA